MILAFLRSVWAIIRKDIRVWLSNRRNIAATVIPLIAFLLIQALGSAAVGRSPVALVTLDSGAKGQQMQQIFHNADDIRRSVPDAITQFYQAQGSTSPIKVTVQDQNLRTRDVQLFQYAVLPTIILLLTLSGLVTASIATSREWETRTIKEMLLSPTSRVTIIVGKVLAGFVTTFLLGVLVRLLGAALDWTRPVGIYWLTSLIILAMIALFSTGLGVALGAALHKSQPVIAISINVAIYLFFLAGGIGVIAFEPLWLQNIAAYIPLTNGIHALEQAVFYSSSDLFGRDMLVLGLCALAALGLGVLSMRRGIAN